MDSRKWGSVVAWGAVVVVEAGSIVATAQERPSVWCPMQCVAAGSIFRPVGAPQVSTLAVDGIAATSTGVSILVAT